LIRFDGLYVSEPLGDGSYRSFFRFYPNGEVVSSSVLATGTPEQVWAWLGSEGRTDSKGRFEVADGEVSFYTIFPGSIDYRDGTEFPEIRVEYKGPILEDGSLRMQFHSLLTDNRGEETYRFAAIA